MVEVCRVWRPFDKGSVWALCVVEVDPAIDDAFGLEAIRRRTRWRPAWDPFRGKYAAI